MTNDYEDMKRRAEAYAGASNDNRGLFGRMADFSMAARSLTQRLAKPVLAVVMPVARVVTSSIGFVAPWLWPVAKKTALFMATSKDEQGKRHFSPKRLALNIASTFVTGAVLPVLLMGGYYYGTLKTYHNVYIPNAGVYMNQQYDEPNGRKIIATRDEIETIMGTYKDEKGNVEHVRFDMDVNPYFFFFGDAMRPDLAAIRVNSYSPLGVKCTIKATGIYTRLPRALRFKNIKWLNFRPEIVKIDDVEQVVAIPDFLKMEESGDGLRFEMKAQPSPQRADINGTAHQMAPSGP